MKIFRVWPVLLIAVAMIFVAGLYACGEDEEDDSDDNPCDSLVDDPLTDCDEVCTEQTCVGVMECEILGKIESMEVCLSECQKGCNMGCIPVGTLQCLDSTDNCDSLVDCMTPLYNY